jgi:hypothetical protein
MSVAQKLFEGNSPAKSGSTDKITCQKGQMCAHRENKGLATIPTGVELFAIGQSTSVMHGALLTPLWEVLAIPSLQNRSLDTHFCSVLIQTYVLSLCSIFDGFLGTILKSQSSLCIWTTCCKRSQSSWCALK